MPIKSPEVLVQNASAWRQWLANNHTKPGAIWLVVGRQEGAIPNLVYQDALDEALCYGWIDSGGGPRDADTRYVRFGPRKPNSPWSKRNIGFIERLQSQGRMAEPGKNAVDRAKTDGFWDAAYSASHVPDDLAVAIIDSEGAQSAWDSMTKKDRYAILVRLGSLPISSESRSKKITSVVEKLRNKQIDDTPETTIRAKIPKDREVSGISKGTRSSKRLAEARSEGN